MDLRRFLDLYVAETGEHVRLLHRSLLRLEEEPAGDAVAEAFRAAHTLKGLSAAMGYGTVTHLAHGLEDRLDEIRAGRLQALPATIDAMLEQADRLEAAIAEAITTAPGPVADAAPAGAASVAEPGSLHVPADAAVMARVRLRADAPVKSARALIIMRALDGLAGVLGSEPAQFDEDFGGEFVIYFSAAADSVAAEAIVAAAGEVESVVFADAQQQPPAAAGTPAAAGPAAAGAPVAAGQAPQRQLRVDAHRLDQVAEGIGELSVLFSRLGPDGVAAAATGEMLGRMGTVLAGLQRDVLQLRTVALREAFERLPRVVRDAARTVGRDVELVVEGDEVELDRAIIEEIGDPLVHLLRNAVDHGIEPTAERVRAGKPARGRIRIAAERERSSVRITVSDDGGGVARERVAARARAAGLLPADAGDDLTDEELFRLLSQAGVSTAEQVSAVSGRGVGMDVVVSRIRALGGAIDMRTRTGEGTTFVIRLPITLAMAQALRVRLGDEEYAIPLTHVSEAVDLNGNVNDGADVLRLREEQVPLVRLRRVLQVPGEGSEETAVIAVRGDRRAALVVDELIGREQILVKGFDPVVGTLPYFSGATLLADGRPALVLDPLSVI
jgi:two-component system, chemotaxis family, sensor kinase CheA